MYLLWIIAGLAACVLALVWQMDDQKPKALPALGTALLSALLGFAAAKIGYVLLQLESTLFYDGLQAFFDMDADGFSYFFGVAGAFGGIWLSARLFKRPQTDWLNWAAPCVALFIAFLRAGEKELGTIGVGSFVPEGSLLARFPFAVANSYGEHLYAIFYLEALFALVLAVILLLRRNGKWFSHRAELCAFFLALPQVLCESLRARCLRWGFVRVEQLLCGLLLLGLLIYACSRMKGAFPAVRRYWPVGAAVLLIAAIGLLEYALDKTGIPVPVCYAMMAAVLTGLGLLEGYALRRR